LHHLFHLELVAGIVLKPGERLGVTGCAAKTERIPVLRLPGLCLLQIGLERRRRVGERLPERTGRSRQPSAIGTRRIAERGVEIAGAGAERARERVTALAEKRR
jgi:hypothetical protein